MKANPEKFQAIAIGKQTPILRGQQRGNGSAKMISMAMQFIIINLKKNI
jgi:hypothetical protein